MILYDAIKKVMTMPIESLPFVRIQRPDAVNHSDGNIIVAFDHSHGFMLINDLSDDGRPNVSFSFEGLMCDEWVVNIYTN